MTLSTELPGAKDQANNRSNSESGRSHPSPQSRGETPQQDQTVPPSYLLGRSRPRRFHQRLPVNFIVFFDGLENVTGLEKSISRP